MDGTVHVPASLRAHAAHAAPARRPTGPRGRFRCRPDPLLPTLNASSTMQERTMGKYVLAWILGVPAIVLVLIYFFFR